MRSSATEDKRLGPVLLRIAMEKDAVGCNDAKVKLALP
jgi:hypothetical protein